MNFVSLRLMSVRCWSSTGWLIWIASAPASASARPFPVPPRRERSTPFGTGFAVALASGLKVFRMGVFLMTQQNQKLPIRSRDDRARDLAARERGFLGIPGIL